MMILKGMHNSPTAWIGIENGLCGPNLTYSTACSSSGVAIGEPWLRLACGAMDIAIAGGAEAPLSLGFLLLGHRIRRTSLVQRCSGHPSRWQCPSILRRGRASVKHRWQHR